MPRTALTPRYIAALKTDQAQLEVWDSVVPGLSLRVGAGGTKAYYVRYRLHGRYRRLKLGKHPILTLAQARDRARAALGQTATGQDPAIEIQVAKKQDITFGALAREVLEAKAKSPKSSREKTVRERTRIVHSELLPQWENRAASSITNRDVIQLIDRIKNRGAPTMANRVLAAIKMIFRSGLRRGFPGLERNPAEWIELEREEARKRYLTKDEMRVVWKTTAWEGPITRNAFRLALLTAQRIGNVRALRWADIDEADVWRIPRALFKGKREHLVPLSAEALGVLEEMRALTGNDEYVFRGRSDGTKGHFDSTHRALQRIRSRTPLPNWTVHDFRTTYRTHATRAQTPAHPKDPAGLGIAIHVADAVLGHKENSVGFTHYNGDPDYYLLAEKRDALTRWGAFVLAAVSENGHA